MCVEKNKEVIMKNPSKEIFDGFFYFFHAVGRLKAAYYVALSVNKKLGEVPFYVAFLIIVGITLAHHTVHELAALIACVKPSEALLALQIGEEW